MRKGITPIIAIIILLLITVSLAGLAWTYLSGILTGRTEGSFVIPTNGIFCDEDPTTGNTHIRVLIQNTGISKNLRYDDFIIAEVDGKDVSSDLNKTVVIKPKESDFILDTDCRGTCGSGVKKVRLGTKTIILEEYVTCP